LAYEKHVCAIRYSGVTHAQFATLEPPHVATMGR
jgi:hypothetical protein